MIILHLDYDMMAGIIQLLTLLLIAVYSVNAPNTDKAMRFGFKMMFAAAFFAHAVISGPGPSFLPAIFMLPITGAVWGGVIAALTRFVKKRLAILNDPDLICRNKNN